MASVVFDYTTWLARFPGFSTTPNIAVVAPLMFKETSLYVSNTDASPVTDLGVRALILNLLTAHLVAINYGEGPFGASSLVGRISSATEGSVTVSTSYADVKTGSRAWYDQTKYGAQVWQALAPFRTFRYIGAPAPCPTLGVWPYLYQ